MGGWKLEVAKMALYMAFPVALFHVFNQPSYFEDWVVSVKNDLYPPDNPKDREMYEKAVINMRKRDELRLLKALEEKNH